MFIKTKNKKQKKTMGSWVYLITWTWECPSGDVWKPRICCGRRYCGIACRQFLGGECSLVCSCLHCSKKSNAQDEQWCRAGKERKISRLSKKKKKMLPIATSVSKPSYYCSVSNTKAAHCKTSKDMLYILINKCIVISHSICICLDDS